MITLDNFDIDDVNEVYAAMQWYCLFTDTERKAYINTLGLARIAVLHRMVANIVFYVGLGGTGFDEECVRDLAARIRPYIRR